MVLFKYTTPQRYIIIITQPQKKEKSPTPHMDIIKKIKNYTYNERHCLGQGSFGRVYEGRSDQGLKVAIKKTQQSMVSKDPYLRSSLQTQINIMKKLNHPNIVKLYDVVITNNSIYLIMEYCAGGDLRRFLRNRRLTQQQAITIIKQISKGFQQIVQLGIIHRDLKPANILVHEGVFKICDFGFAKFFHDNSRMARTCVGTPIYMSPQVLSQKSYTDKTDVWSLGVLFFELLFGKLPYYGTTEDALFKNITRNQLVLPNCSNYVAGLLKGMMQIQQIKRFSWAKLFQALNLPPQQQNRQQNNFVAYGSQKQMQAVQNNGMGFYKPPQMKKQSSNNNIMSKQQYDPQLANMYKQNYAQKYGAVQIVQQQARKPQRKPKNPLAFQNPVQNLFQQQQQQQQVPQPNQINNQNGNQNPYQIPNPKRQPTIPALQIPLPQKQPNLQPPTNNPQALTPSAENPRFLYFVLIELIVDPIKNCPSYPQLVSAVYRKAIECYNRVLEKENQKQNLTLYGKVLMSQYEEMKSLEMEIPNYPQASLERIAEAVVVESQSEGNVPNSLLWIYKILAKNYTYQR